MDDKMNRIIKIYNNAADTHDVDVVIVYGQSSGNIINCENVVVINSQLVGNIINCENVLGTLADISDGCKEVYS